MGKYSTELFCPAPICLGNGSRSLPPPELSFMFAIAIVRKAVPKLASAGAAFCWRLFHRAPFKAGQVFENSADIKAHRSANFHGANRFASHPVFDGSFADT
jgi:hypothetical protein